MNTRILSIAVFVVLLIVLEIYTYSGLKTLINQPRQLKIYNLIFLFHLLFSIIATAYIIYDFSLFKSNRSLLVNIISGYLFSAFIFKLIFSSMLFLQDSGRLFITFFDYLKNLLSNSQNAETVTLRGRREFLTTGSLFVAAIPFVSLLYGITIGKYKFVVNKLQLGFKDLPQNFSGFKVLQISDIHAGSFDSIESVAKGIELINQQDADIVLFTGDLVNMDKNEILPYIQIFKKIKAKFGKFAVLGNHDYIGMDTSDDPQQYLEDLNSIFNEMGFRLLLNESTSVEINGEKIYIAGVENWGRDSWFPKKGDLNKALLNVPNDAFTILMSHDPTHWDEVVKKHTRIIPLTLSGHTHGMQFGIDFSGLRWSPAKYNYPQWKGLYEENDRKLYVNIGFGFIGFAGRVGMWPEISVFELQKVGSSIPS